MGDLSENFSRWEFACKCKCGFDTVDYDLILVLEDVRNHFDAACTINSGSRCRLHNMAIGGSFGSQHLKSKAVDFKVADVLASDVADYLEEKYQKKYWIGRYEGRTHIDVRKEKARWG